MTQWFLRAPTRDRKVEELTASELVLRQYAFMQQISIEELERVRRCARDRQTTRSTLRKAGLEIRDQG